MCIDSVQSNQALVNQLLMAWTQQENARQIHAPLQQEVQHTFGLQQNLIAQQLMQQIQASMMYQHLKSQQIFHEQQKQQQDEQNKLQTCNMIMQILNLIFSSQPS